MGHLAWVLVNYGVVLVLVDNSAGFSPVTRLLSTAFVLGVASVTVSWLVAGRRRTMNELQHEVAIREELERQLQELADQDHLTGLSNRRRLERESAREIAEARRRGVPLTVAMIDIDGFKLLNDTAGHAEGDELLKTAAYAWSGVLRAHDLLARVGGDEFVAVLTGCGEEQATAVLERMRAAMPPGANLLDRGCRGRPRRGLRDALAEPTRCSIGPSAAAATGSRRPARRSLV